MANNEKPGRVHKSVQKFIRTALATTCLTVMSGGLASAGSVIYDDDTTAEYQNSAANALLLANQLAAATGGLGSNTTTAIGHFCNSSTAGCGAIEGNDDWFEVTGLIANQTVVYSTTDTGPGGEGSPTGTQGITITNDTQTQTFLNVSLNGLPSGNFTVPSDGNVLFDITSGEGRAQYSVTLTQTTGVPEPSTVSGVGLALAGALALRRKFRKA